jgi:hypothetical protein
MPRLSLCTAVVAAAALMLSAVSSLAAPPSDVAAIAQVYSLVASDASSGDLRDELYSLAINSVERVITANDLADHAQQRGLIPWLENRVLPGCDAMARDPKRNKKEFDAYVREISSSNFAHRLISEWLRVPGYQTPSGAAPKAGTPLTGQVNPRHSSTGLRLDVESSRVLADTGGPGSNNGVIDAGEWVQVRWVVGNPTPRPYVSSSAWIRSSHSCTWVNEASEYVLSEMDPEGGRASFRTWVFFSRLCPGGDRVTLTAKIRDTHRTRSGEEVIQLDLQVRPRSGIRLVGTKIDTDIPGYSDGKPLPELEEGHRFEYSTGVEVLDPSAEKVVMTYRLAEAPGALFKQANYRQGELIPVGRGRFSFYDDLDLRSHARAQFEQVLRALQLNRGERWFDGTNNLLWIAVDTVVGYPPPDGTGSEVTEKVVTTAQPSVGPREFKAFVEQHARIVARPARPVLPGAIAATEGYEIVVDWAELDALFARIETTEIVVTPRQPLIGYRYRNYLSLPVRAIETTAHCPDRDGDGYSDKFDSDASCPDSSDCNDQDASIHPYANEICGDGIDQDCNGRDESCAPVARAKRKRKPKKAKYKGRMDLGLALGIAQTSADHRRNWWGNAGVAALFWLDLRLSFGETHSFVLEFSGSPPRVTSKLYTDTDLIGTFDARVTTGSISVLLGYAWQGRVNRHLELAPRLLGGVGIRTLRGGYLPFGVFVDNPEETAAMPRLVFEPGLTVRFLPAKNFGLYLDLALNLGSPSLSVNEDILGVFMVRLGTGISVRF